MQLKIVTPNEEKVNLEVGEVTLPGSQGELGILPDHTPLMASLWSGIVRFKGTEKSGAVAVSRGFAEVLENNVLLMVENAEFPEDIDVERAREALKRANTRLAEAAHDLDLHRAERAARRAQARIDVVEG